MGSRGGGEGGKGERVGLVVAILLSHLLSGAQRQVPPGLPSLDPSKSLSKHIKH